MTNFTVVCPIGVAFGEEMAADGALAGISDVECFEMGYLWALAAAAAAPEWAMAQLRRTDGWDSFVDTASRDIRRYPVGGPQ